MAEPETKTEAVDPLAELNIDSISQIFSMDPRDLSRPQINLVVQKMREWRAKFKADEAAGKKPTVSKRLKVEKTAVPSKASKDLADDLGI